MELSKEVNSSNSKPEEQTIDPLILGQSDSELWLPDGFAESELQI